MIEALNEEQVNQVIHNTIVVMLARQDLQSEWQADLFDLLHQAQTADMIEEAIFLAAVIALLDSPDDELPTGTRYDPAWHAIRTGLDTGSLPGTSQSEISLDRLLQAVVNAIVTVRRDNPHQVDALEEELHEMRAAAAEAGAQDLLHWLDDTIEVLHGSDPAAIASAHTGMFADQWHTLTERLQSVD